MFLKIINTLWQPLGDLLFPKFCAACDQTIIANEFVLCFECRHNLPFTKMEQLNDNEAQIKFLTKLPLAKAASMLYFVEEGLVREMMHRLKYQNRPEIGNLLGLLLARQFNKVKWFNDIDALIPVPLFHKKQNLRGYNQAETISEGIAEFTGLPVWNDVVFRIKNTASQTQKNRKERQENVHDAFILKKPNKLRNKHILLIDDVLTTGATMASCGQAILSATPCTLSLATAAIAHH